MPLKPSGVPAAASKCPRGCGGTAYVNLDAETVCPICGYRRYPGTVDRQLKKGRQMWWEDGR